MEMRILKGRFKQLVAKSMLYFHAVIQKERLLKRRDEMVHWIHNGYFN